MQSVKTHTFAICAYKDSPYLESCIKSLMKQTVKTDVILCTSTPSEYIEQLAVSYGIPVYVRDGQSDIGEDWNFAYHMADGEYVTIAHQDDMYHKRYTETLLECAGRYPDMTLFTTDYAVAKMNPVTQGTTVSRETVSVVKVLLRLPLRLRSLSHLTWVKKSVLMFGNAICCPSCTYHKKSLGEPLFSSPFKYALDWDTLCKLAERPGRFICAERPLMSYRIHEGAATKACIMDHRRVEEETEMFRKFWPEPVVRLIMHFYTKAADAYN